MATYKVYDDQEKIYDFVQRLCLHHDHLKTLIDAYNYMRQKETYARMRDPEFRCDSVKMNQLDSSYFTSLIVKLSFEQGAIFFEVVNQAYQKLNELVQNSYPNSKVEIYFDSAHITIKSILDFAQQSEVELETYLPIVSPTLKKWISLMGEDTQLFGMGLFTNLHKDKGLSVGVRFYPTLPLIQILRGEIGVQLYSSQSKIQLRPERTFHTMLTHSTGFRARNLEFPLQDEFCEQFKNLVEKYDQRVFGSISNIAISDVYIRNGFSDKLIPHAEIPVA
jgi:hypothetical protein